MKYRHFMLQALREAIGKQTKISLTLATILPIHNEERSCLLSFHAVLRKEAVCPRIFRVEFLDVDEYDMMTSLFSIVLT